MGELVEGVAAQVGDPAVEPADLLGGLAAAGRATYAVKDPAPVSMVTVSPAIRVSVVNALSKLRTT